jgi:hypothetical protein
MTSEGGYPIFNGSNYPTFRDNFLDEARPIGGDIVKGLRARKKFIRPDIDLEAKLINGTVTILRYERHTDDSLTSDGKKTLRSDLVQLEAFRKADGTIEATLTALLFKRISRQVRATLKSSHKTVYVKAVDSDDIFTILELLDKSYATGNGQMLCRNLTDLLTFKQNALPHEEFLESFYLKSDQVCHDFADPTHVGYIKMDHLLTAVYTAGVDPTYFSAKLDAHHLAYPDGKTPSLDVVTASFQSYHMSKTPVTRRELSSQHAGSNLSDLPLGEGAPSKALAASSVISRRCKTCLLPFQTTHDYFYCVPCTKDYKAKQEHKKQDKANVVRRPSSPHPSTTNSFFGLDPDDSDAYSDDSYRGL